MHAVNVLIIRAIEECVPGVHRTPRHVFLLWYLLAHACVQHRNIKKCGCGSEPCHTGCRIGKPFSLNGGINNAIVVVDVANMIAEPIGKGGAAKQVKGCGKFVYTAKISIIA